LPREQAGAAKLGFATLTGRGLVAARESLKGKAAIFIKANEMIVTQGRVLRFGLERISDVLQEKRAIALEINAKIDRQRIDGLIDDQLVSIAAPGAREVG